MKKFLALAFVATLFFGGCGYKPSSYYAKQTFGDGVFVNVTMLRSDPENTVIIKDAINEAVITKFKSKIVSEDKAETKLNVRVDAAAFSPIQYDKNGYVTLYRATVTLNSVAFTKKGVKNFTSSGSYDFPIEPNSTISDSKRFEAIKNSGAKAIDMLISQISILGALDEVRTDSGKSD